MLKVHFKFSAPLWRWMIWTHTYGLRVRIPSFLYFVTWLLKTGSSVSKVQIPLNPSFGTGLLLAPKTISNLIRILLGQKIVSITVHKWPKPIPSLISCTPFLIFQICRLVFLKTYCKLNRSEYPYEDKVHSDDRVNYKTVYSFDGIKIDEAAFAESFIVRLEKEKNMEIKIWNS